MPLSAIRLGAVTALPAAALPVRCAALALAACSGRRGRGPGRRSASTTTRRSTRRSSGGSPRRWAPRGSRSRRSTCAGTTRSRPTVPTRRAVIRGDRGREGERPDGRARPLSRSTRGLHGGQHCTPRPTRRPAATRAEIEAFAAWTAQVAPAFPTVHEFVVMNECNQPLFVNPQFNSSGANQSAEICGRALVASYDALKAVSSANFVWGVGLSPRGNDNPNAGSNVVDLAGRLPAGPRRLVQGVRGGDRPHEAADGRARLPPLPDPAVAALRDRLRRPDERDGHEPRPGSTRPSTTASTARRSRRSGSRPAAACRSR